MIRTAVPLLLLALAALATPIGAVAQRVPAGLEALPLEVAEAWFAPLPRALGPALAAGFFTSARPPRGLALGLRLSVGRFPGRDRSFAPPVPATLSFGGETFQEPYVVQGAPTSPTVAGDGTGAVLTPRPGSEFEAALLAAGEDPEEHRIPLPDGLDLPGAPAPSVELSLGVGTLLAVTGRFFPRVELDDDLGDVGGFGVGALLSVDRFVPVPLGELAVTGALQQMDVGGYLDASGTAVGILASAGAGPARIYAHGQLVGQETEVAWRVRNPGGVVGLPADGTPLEVRYEPGTDARLALGAALDLPRFGLSGEVSPGSPRVFSVQFSLGLR